jgi:hypothetical protein
VTPRPAPRDRIVVDGPVLSWHWLGIAGPR